MKIRPGGFLVWLIRLAGGAAVVAGWAGWLPLSWPFLLLLTLVVLLSWVSRGVGKRAPHLPSAEEVAQACQRLRSGPWLNFRSLHFRLLPTWSVRPIEMELGRRLQASDLGCNILVAVRWCQPSDDVSLDGLLRDESKAESSPPTITLLSGLPAVAQTRPQADGAGVRKITCIYHRSWYQVRVVAPDARHLETIRPAVDAFFDECCFREPELLRRRVLGGRIEIGVPAEWFPTQEEARRAAWRGEPGPTYMRVHLLAEGHEGPLDIALLRELPHPNFRAALAAWEYDLAETGAHVLTVVPEARRGLGQGPWSAHLLSLPGGLLVAVELDHRGGEAEIFAGFLMRNAFLNELLTTIQDARLPSF